MNIRLKKTAGMWAVAFSALTFGSTTAHALIVIEAGVDNQGVTNVLLDGGTDVPTVTGTVGPAGPVVNFTSTGGDLSAPAQGQARVSAGADNDPFNQLRFSLASGDQFTQAVVNINAETDGMVMFTVLGTNITQGVQSFEVDANGQNFFTISAINGQLISSISLLGTEGATFEDVRQVRVGGVVSAIPEPETYALMMAGLGAIGFMARRRKQKQS